MGNTKPLILLSPLDWGLGHTTRCIPIIHTLLAVNCTVIVACNNRQKELLSREFPQLTFLDLPGYNVQYSTGRWRTLAKIIFQLPALLTKVKQEHTWLQSFLKEHTPDLIISDNRFGFYSDTIPSVFITHQLQIETGLGKLINRIARKLNYRFIRKFNYCWVPDNEGSTALAGKLSNPSKVPFANIHYLGPLSRLERCTHQPIKNIPLLIILSGPEPQRTIFETKLLEQLQQLTIQAVVIRGLTGKPAPESLPSHVTIYDHIPSEQLNAMMCAADMIISRAGYTTIMDVLKLGKKSIQVPTPGQAEQEYLATWLQQKQYSYTVSQSAFVLTKALQAAANFPYQLPAVAPDTYKQVITELVNTVSITRTASLIKE